MRNVIRTILAFFVATLIPAAVISMLMLWSERDLGAALLAFAMLYPMSAVYTIGFGLPAFLILLLLRPGHWWSVLVVGLLLGGGVAVALRSGYPLLFEDVTIFAPIGAVTTLVFWSIWRPGQRSRPSRTYLELPILLFGWLVATPYLAPVYRALFPNTDPPVYQGDTLFDLFLWHTLVVVTASAAAIALGVGGGMFVTRDAGRDFRASANALATIGQTFPPIALLAIAVPAIGYGFWPTFIALALYGVLPILANTVAGIEAVSPAAREAARGMGLSPAQILRDVELPLALPVILAGVRTSVIINIGTAALGATVGADTLGTPIIDGLVVDKLAYVIQGGVAVALMAIVTDAAFERLQKRFTRYQSINA